VTTKHNTTYFSYTKLDISSVQNKNKLLSFGEEYHGRINEYDKYCYNIDLIDLTMQ